MKKSALKLAIAAAAFASTGAMAATNPAAAGLTSTGDLVVSIIKGDLVRISQLADITFPAMATMAANTTQGVDVCVFSTLGGYNITTSSANAFGPQLRMSDGGVNTLDYSVSWTDGTLATAALPHAANVTGLLGADSVNETCLGGQNARIDATILAADFNAAPQAAYADTLTLTFAPE